MLDIYMMNVEAGGLRRAGVTGSQCVERLPGGALRVRIQLRQQRHERPLQFGGRCGKHQARPPTTHIRTVTAPAMNGSPSSVALVRAMRALAGRAAGLW